MNNEYSGAFASAFRAYLEEQGITQSSVAQAAGMSASQLAQYLAADDTARREPTFPVALRLLAASGAVSVRLREGEMWIESVKV